MYAEEPMQSEISQEDKDHYQHMHVISDNESVCTDD